MMPTVADVAIFELTIPAGFLPESDIIANTTDRGAIAGPPAGGASRGLPAGHAGRNRRSRTGTRRATTGALKGGGSGPKNDVMVRIAAHRLQAVVLILTVALALVGEAFAPTAMAMQPAKAAMAGTPSSGSATCPTCKDMDASKAAAAACAIGACLGSAAVPPAAAAFETTTPAAFAKVAESEGRGIAVPPDPGPPRSLPLA
jgi:hypothetical protein